jgi:hypothetical protein
MRIRVDPGSFRIYETSLGEVARFSSVYGFDLVPAGEFFTFKELANAPRYSLEGAQYLGATASKTFEGAPWEIFEANGLVFDFTKGLVRPIGEIDVIFDLKESDGYYLANGLILPGALTDRDLRVKDYSAWYSWGSNQFGYSEVSYV